MLNEIARAGPNVLLVMEDMFFRKLLRRQLQRAGYVVNEALSVERALHRLSSAVPDVVLLDTWIDHGGGLRLLELLRADERRADMPVLLVGNDTRPSVRRRGAELGALGPLPIAESLGVEHWVHDALARAG
jgi:CheY-like chemotaxis protein